VELLGDKSLIEYRERETFMPAASDATLSEIPSAVDSGFTGETSPTTNVVEATGCGPERELAGRMHLEWAGKYRLVEEVGRGGMGVVYRARDEVLGREVAIKMVLSGYDARAELMRRFREEARAVASLDHPNIVRIYEAGEEQGQPYIAMEFVRGESLSQMIREEPIPSRRAAEIAMLLAGAIEHAHRRNLIHRDIKPSNVLVGNDGVPKLTDFGLARALERAHGPDATVEGQLLGTPQFMPPEQVRSSGNAGVASDVYSIGATLYTMLVGRSPFQADSLAETLRQVLDAEPVDPSRLNPSIPKDLNMICLKCLRKEPARRYFSAGDLRDDLERFLGGRPVLARPLSAFEMLKRWATRNPVVATLAALVLLLVTILVILLLSLIRF
jgi:serine/threonine protein kinase